MGPGKVEIREMDITDPQPDELQVQCVANGICMAEVSMFTGTESAGSPRLVGREGIGVVTKVGHDVDGLSEGDYVTCLKWASVYDYRANIRDFGYLSTAKYAAPPSDPAILLAEPVACVVSALYQYDITPGDRVLLMGAGLMGLWGTSRDWRAIRSLS